MDQKAYRVLKQEYPNDIHFVPMDDVIEHEYTPNCDCIPRLAPETVEDMKTGLVDNYVWQHRRIKEGKESLV